MYQKYKTFEEFRDGLFKLVDIDIYKPRYGSIKIKIDDRIDINIKQSDIPLDKRQIKKIWREYVNYFDEKRKEAETNSSDDSS
jgi:hypothetical protein